MSNETEQIFLLNPSEAHSSGSLQKVVENPVGAQVNLEDVEDFSTVCRTCATITEFVIPIFSGDGLQNNLADKIHKHLPIQVTEEDALPRAVCYQCANTLLAWHELVACCEHADRALHARLQQMQLQRHNSAQTQNHKPMTDQEIPIEEKNQQKQFEEIEKLVEQPPRENPPGYPESPAPALTTCPYCPTQHNPDDYKEHLIQAHTDLFFHCDECDGYVDRKDFILHMSLHVVQYSSGKKKDETKRTIKKKKKLKDENENTETDERSVTSSERIDPKFIEMDIPADVATPALDELSNTNNDRNEFSDHSDTEFGFGPLPESVFEAIEDSQESHVMDSDLTNTAEVIENIRIDNETDTDIVNNKMDVEVSNNDAKVTENPNIEIDTKTKHKKTRTCPICGKVYTVSSSYFYHMKFSHKKTRDYKCDLCGNKFWSKMVLTAHMITHSEIYENECKVCGKRVKSKASLYIHAQTHTGTKKFSCDQCQSSFRWRTHLLRHLKRHSAEKPHVCSTCGKGFTIRCDLLRHIRTHTAGKYECQKCGVSFAQARYLKTHLDKKHVTKDVVGTVDVEGTDDSGPITASETQIGTDISPIPCVNS